MKLGCRRNYHKGRAAIRQYDNLREPNLGIAFVSSSSHHISSYLRNIAAPESSHLYEDDKYLQVEFTLYILNLNAILFE